jgi:protein-S-isoprenylcysteine O-methyltransferase Ste14
MVLGLVGYFLAVPTTTRLAFMACAVAYLIVGLSLEERKLLKQFGPAYVRYQQQVPWLIPTRRPHRDYAVQRRAANRRRSA